MQYNHTVLGTLVDRPNRFVAHVQLGDSVETVHVKNTGRCRELLLPGSTVVLAQGDNPARKTKYDLIAVWKDPLGWVNIDSQAPNQVMKDWLDSGESCFGALDVVRPEVTWGKSRFDFYLERGQERILLEVKGCTLEVDGVGYFPDAPTERGVKHLRELAAAVTQGYVCYLAFVIAMPGVRKVLPNVATDPAFGAALAEAEAAGVHILYVPCAVAPDSLRASTGPMVAQAERQ